MSLYTDDAKKNRSELGEEMEENSDLEDHFQNNNRLGLIKRKWSQEVDLPSWHSKWWPGSESKSDSWYFAL